MRTDELISTIKLLLNPAALSQKYQWDFTKKLRSSSNPGLSNEEIKSIMNSETPFEKNRILKKILSKKLVSIPFNYPILFWIIREWGGIRAFKVPKHDEEKNYNTERIQRFYHELLTGESISPDLFKILPSLSKISSFWSPERYAIYDNRAVYTLNFIIHEANKKGAGLKYFPIGKGSRNTMIIAKPIENLIGNDARQFYHEGIAYFKYCELISQINEVLYPEYPDEIYRTEMLLFSSIDVPFRAMNGDLSLSKALRIAELHQKGPNSDSLSERHKYYPLQEYLQNAIAESKTEVLLTIEEINRLVSGLPETAFKHSVFWGNDFNSPTHMQKRAWLSQGFIVSRTTNLIDRSRKKGDSIPKDGTVEFRLFKKKLTDFPKKEVYEFGTHKIRKSKTSEKKSDIKLDSLSPDQKYYPIQRILHNANQAGTLTVTLTIGEINQELGKIGKGFLPSYAYKHPAFWGNDYSSPTHMQKRAWLSQGFKVANKDGVLNPAWKEGIDAIPVNGKITFKYVGKRLDNQSQSIGNEIESDLKEVLNELYGRIVNEFGNNAPSYFSHLLNEQNLTEAVQQFLLAPVPSDGFKSLLLSGRLDLTLEFFIVNNSKYHSLFSQEVITKSKERIGR